MGDYSLINRRDFLLNTATAVGGVNVLAAVNDSAATAEAALPQDIHIENPLAQYWQKTVSNLVEVKLPQELSRDLVKERHQIYSLLLMALIVRFWNGNNNGPVGIYPHRENQRASDQDSNAVHYRYMGDMNESDDPHRVSWDRYLGHNIACLAVDGNGEVIDFDFNHNNFFRSSAEHAESRMVRRLFSLTDLIDNWKTGQRVPGKSRAFSLKDVTIYTSLESCAQCSGVMSLGRVKEVVFLQNDPGAYRVGNIMYNLAGREDLQHGDGSALAALPVAASEIGLPYLNELNGKYEQFRAEMADAEKNHDATRAYFIRRRGSEANFTQSITSFLCTDAARDVFVRGGNEFRTMALKHSDSRYPDQGDVWTNRKCLEKARQFFAYADVEGFRGSPHKL